MVRLVAAAVGVVVVAAAPAHAGPKSKAKYEQALRRGNELFDQGKWAEARAEFEKAYAADPRPVVLFNIGSTYRHEHALDKAIEYYRRYLDKDPNGDHAQLARETIASLNEELEREEARRKADDEAHRKAETSSPVAEHVTPPDRIVVVAPSAPAQVPYPQAVIERPATLVGGTFAASGGVALYPHAEVSMMGPVSTVYDPYVTAQLRYAVNDHVELAVEGDVDMSDTDRSIVFGQLAFGLLHGPRTTLGASASFGYDTGAGEAGLASFGAMVRIKLADTLAVISSEDQLVLELAEPRDYQVRLPIGLAYQITPIAYAAVSTQLATFEFRQPVKLRFLFASETYVATDLVIAPSKSVDAVFRFRAYDDGRDGVFAIRWRM